MIGGRAWPFRESDDVVHLNVELVDSKHQRLDVKVLEAWAPFARRRIAPRTCNEIAVRLSAFASPRRCPASRNGPHCALQ